MNELSSLLKRAFEGLGFGDGVYEDAASAVLWMETHGLHGLDAVGNAWQRLQSDSCISVKIVSDEPGHSVLDAGGSSALVCGAKAVDLAYAKAVETGTGCIELCNCPDRRLIIANLVTCARRGCSALAHWNDGPLVHLAIIELAETCPTYRQYQRLHANTDAAESVIVVCSKNFGGLQQYVSMSVEPGCNTAGIECVTATAMQDYYERLLDDGICVDDELWHRLSAAADNVLVEASERSRRGAGEQN